MEPKEMNIYQKLHAITSEIENVKKNLTVELPNGRGYKAVGEVDVLNAVRPLEEKYRVYSYPMKRDVIETGETETKSGTKNLFMREKVVYRFVNIDKPDEYVDQEAIGDGIDSQDKAPGKAATYADKYALLKGYKIPTGDDPDQKGSAELKKSRIAKTDESYYNTENYKEISSLIKNTDITSGRVAVLCAERYGEGVKVNQLKPKQFAEFKELIQNEVIERMAAQ